MEVDGCEVLLVAISSGFVRRLSDRIVGGHVLWAVLGVAVPFQRLALLTGLLDLHSGHSHLPKAELSSVIRQLLWQWLVLGLVRVFQHGHAFVLVWLSLQILLLDRHKRVTALGRSLVVGSW